MDAFASALNDLLVNTFHSILKLEETSLQRISSSRLSLNELHLLEAVARVNGEGRSITDIARELNITLPSVTTAVNKLERKGFVKKTRDRDDRRLVIVCLTGEGRRAEASHRFFHRHMVTGVTQGMSAQEKSALLKGLHKLHAFFLDQETVFLKLPPAEFQTEEEEKE